MLALLSYPWVGFQGAVAQSPWRVRPRPWLGPISMVRRRRPSRPPASRVRSAGLRPPLTPAQGVRKRNTLRSPTENDTSARHVAIPDPTEVTVAPAPRHRR